MPLKKYNIAEIFYSIQGEGFHTGRPAVFVRFSGCNLSCKFCDTNHNLTEIMTGPQIIDQIKHVINLHGLDKQPYLPWIVLTGGEPMLQIDESLLLMLMDSIRFKSKNHPPYLAIETNGTVENPIKNSYFVPWITISPKTSANELKISVVNEIKFLMEPGVDPEYYLQFWIRSSKERVLSEHYYVQPLDTGDEIKTDRNIKLAIDYCMRNPRWKLSMQLQKILKIK